MAVTDSTDLFSLQCFIHLLHARVSRAVHGPAVDVIAVLTVGHDEQAHVTDRAQINVLLHLVLNESLAKEGEEGMLDNS